MQPCIAAHESCQSLEGFISGPKWQPTVGREQPAVHHCTPSSMLPCSARLLLLQAAAPAASMAHAVSRLAVGPHRHLGGAADLCGRGSGGSRSIRGTHIEASRRAAGEGQARGGTSLGGDKLGGDKLHLKMEGESALQCGRGKQLKAPAALAPKRPLAVTAATHFSRVRLNPSYARAHAAIRNVPTI